ncbi:MAG TPA: DNA mismatch repair endonuclease MutL, partial [Clostridia bacterium]|nr:DNA mismatch repair endonuclease MutL [Clostridia bacterium]
MGRINILTSDVYNLISAGEVVERPASVVKELIENSIDAGATEIDVEIENGGISLIRISDNGIGILPEDIKSVFLPHATSKLKIADDLDTIATLGFRGEALASISAVSEVNLVSKTESAEVAVALSVKGGVYGNVEYLAGKKGTTITVQNLFYNTPARIKFLKKPKSEEHLVTSKIQELALANPEISFKYTVDKRLLFSTDGTSMLSALHSIYDRATMRELVPFSTNHGAISLSGYFSKPTYTKANRSYQTIIINGRVVSCNTVSTAIERAYAPYLMKRSFPMFIVSIMLPFDTVDVNVHPAKSEVRFADNNAVFGFVFSVMREMLSSTYNIKTFGQDFVAKDIEQSNFEDINPNEIKTQNQAGKIYTTSTENNYKNKLKIDVGN